METTGRIVNEVPRDVLRAPAFLSTSLLPQFPHLSTGGKRVALLVSYTYWEGQMKKWVSRLLKVKSAESVKQHS